jgi:hypothetical protein
MSDPYRDEVLALRVENERLRRRLEAGARPRGRRAVFLGAVIGGSSVGGFAALLPLLNAPSDTRFFLGLAGAAAIVLGDAWALVALARWATPTHTGA